MLVDKQVVVIIHGWIDKQILGISANQAMLVKYFILCISNNIPLVNSVTLAFPCN